MIKIVFNILILAVFSASALANESSCEIFLEKGEGKPSQEKLMMKMFPGRSKHGPRIIGEQMNDLLLQQHLNYLTGVAPLDDEGCLDERCSTKAKIRARRYFVDFLNELGYEVSLEKIAAPSWGGSSRPNSFSNAKAKALNFETASDEDLLDIWTSNEYSSVVALIRDIFDWTDDADIQKLREITKKDLQTIVKWPDSPISQNNKEVIKVFRGNHVNLSKLDTEMGMHDWKFYAEEAQDLLKRVEKYEKENKGKQAKKKKKPKKKKQADNKPASIEDNDVNLVFEIEGTENPDEIFEITAHYDSVSENVPGADDNGSGVVTLLEIARLLKEFPPKRTVRFVLADLEERGMRGSAHHVDIIANKDENLIGVMVLDMFGYSPLKMAGEKPIFHLEMGKEDSYSSDEEYRKALELAMAYSYQFNLYSDRFVRLSVVKKSGTATDMDSYTGEGISSFLISAPYTGEFITPGYHNGGDVVPQINWGYFTQVAQITIETVARITGMEPGDLIKDKKLVQRLNSFFQKGKVSYTEDDLIVTVPVSTFSTTTSTSSGGFSSGYSEEGWWD